MKYTKYLFILLLFTACNTTPQTEPETEAEQTEIEAEDHTFKTLDITDINNQLEEIKGYLSPLEIMKIHYPHEGGGEGGESVVTTEESLGDGHAAVTLRHNNIMDDSVKDQQIVMELKKQGNLWTVVSLKTNWRCRAGRGHEDWGAEPCQ